MRTDLALAALASAAVPGMRPVAVAGISSGDDGRAGELQSALVEDATGRRWVVRAPLTPVAGARLQRNDELVRQLSRHVPFKVPAAAGYAPVGKEGSAAVYPYVEGSPLDLRRLPAGPGLASAVGRALAAVHNIPRAVFEEQDVPVFDASGARQRAIAEVDRAAETGRVPTGLLARWEEAFEAAPLWQFATTPVHGAFTGSNVVVAFTDEGDAATGRVVAVTDWDEAMVGDPAVDLAELWARSSRQAWEAVLDSYTLARTHRPDPYLHARARLVAELRNLRGLALAVAEGDEETARRAVDALRRMDRLTESDDSLVPLTARPSGARPGAEPTVASASASVNDDSDTGGPGRAAVSGPGGAGDQDGAGPVGDDPDLDVPWSEADPTMEVPAPQSAAEPAPAHTPAPGDEAGRDRWTGPDEGRTAEPAPAVESQGTWAGGSAGAPSWPETPDDDATTWIERPVPEGPEDDGFARGVVEESAGEAGSDGGAAAIPTVEAKAGPDVPPQAETGPVPVVTGRAQDARTGTGDEPGSLRGDDDREADGVPAEDPHGVVVEEAGVGRGTTPPTDESQRTDAADQDVEELDVEELEDEARLHELYGMPAPERDAEGR